MQCPYGKEQLNNKLLRFNIMLALLNTSSIHHFALLVGVFIAIQYRSTYGVIPGGLIVPGSLVVLLTISPLWFVTVLGLSVLVYWIYQQWLRRTDYKRRTPMYILACLSLTISTLVALGYNYFGWLDFSLDTQIGTILPGVIAFNLGKQNVGRVSRAVVLCTGLTLAGVLGILGLLHILGLSLGNSSLVHTAINPGINLEANPAMQLQYPLIHYFLSLGLGYLIYRHQDIRSGGYMVTPIIALTMFDSLMGLHFLIGCVLVYQIAQWFCERTLTVGLKRYVVVLCLSTLYLWGSELWLHATVPAMAQHIGYGSSYLLNIAMLSCVNDAILYRTKPVLRCMALLIATSMVGIWALS